VVLGTLPHGKPILAATARIPGLRFNLSHSHEFALRAFCLGHELALGIDIEKIKPQVAFEGTESRNFSPKERTERETLPQDLRPEGFFLWTCNEAYVKARGEGLKVPLESFSVSLAPGKPAVLQSSDEERWSLYFKRYDQRQAGPRISNQYLQLFSTERSNRYCQSRDPHSDRRCLAVHLVADQRLPSGGPDP
jgi:phosphopantetheinyl transferase